MKIGYCRVSTQEQSLDLQMDALKIEGCEKIYYEKVSGMVNERPQLNELIKFARSGDAIVIYRLDRIGRSTKKLIELAEELESKGIELISICDNIDTTSAIGKAIFRLLAVLAEMERDIIVERTKAGLASARARGRVGGRPPKNRKQIEDAMKLYSSKIYSISEIEKLTSVSKATLYRALKRGTQS